MASSVSMIERPLAQYRQLADALRSAIDRGEYAPGSTFPSETELVAKHGLSRPTVNRALLILRSEGLIRVERGRGTIVRSIPKIPRYATARYTRQHREHNGARGAFDAEIRRLGFEPRSEVIEIGQVRPPGDIATALALPRGRRNTFIRKRHMYANDTPVQFATSYLPWKIVEGTQIEQQDTGPGGIYSRLDELGHGPGWFSETVTLRPPTAEEADFLGVFPDGHILAIFHVAWTFDERPIEITISALPPHQWELHYDVMAG